jgi:type IV secretion system protein VirB11
MSRNLLVSRTLEPLEKYLKTKGLVELIINKPHEIILETSSGGFQTIKDPQITMDYLEGLAHQLAAYAGQKFGELHPILACALPAPYYYRVQIVGKTVVDSGFALAIRAGAANVYPLESWFNAEALEQLLYALNNRKNLLIAGGTSSGKTTLLNSIIATLPISERILTIEDAKELVLPQTNAVQLLKAKTGTDAAKITYKDLINSAVRLRPDRIILGELDIENTLPFLRVLNTGHGGSMATLHADSPEKAIEALTLNVALAGYGGNEAMIERYITNAIDLIVHLKRVNRSTYAAALKAIK